MRFPDDPNPKFVIPVTVEYAIEHKRVSYLLIAAFEGGANYWYRIEGYEEPSATPIWVQKDDLSQFKHAWFALAPGGGIKLSDFYGQDGDERGMTVKTLRTADLMRGLQIMARDYPQHFANFREENDDGETGDVFLQLCMFGKLVYG
jgi:hypothetical protein